MGPLNSPGPAVLRAYADSIDADLIRALPRPICHHDDRETPESRVAGIRPVAREVERASPLCWSTEPPAIADGHQAVRDVRLPPGSFHPASGHTMLEARRGSRRYPVRA